MTAEEYLDLCNWIEGERMADRMQWLRNFYHTIFSPDEIEEGRRLAREQWPEWGGWKIMYDTPMKYLDGYGETDEKKRRKTAYGNALERLRSIPSEIETMLFLHDQGKIILAYDDANEKWFNKDNGVDISFVDRQRPEEGKLYNAFVDVKNHGLKDDNTEYSNLYIEVTGINGNWHAWTDLFKTQQFTYNGVQYNMVPPNRYIAYVRGGRKYGGKYATETEVYSDDLSEAENRRAITEYYFEHQAELLNHDLYIIRGEDMAQYLENELPGLQSDLFATGKRVTEFDLSPSLSDWRDKYPLMQVRRTAAGWETTVTGRGSFQLEAKANAPGSFNISKSGEVTYTQITAEQLAKDEAILRERETDQAKGLSLLTCLAVEGCISAPTLQEWAEEGESIRQKQDQLRTRRQGIMWQI